MGVLLIPFQALAVPEDQRLPIHIEHFIERYGLFVILALGEAVSGITVDMGFGPAGRRGVYLSIVLGERGRARTVRQRPRRANLSIARRICDRLHAQAPLL
jgi:hypothetical protein